MIALLINRYREYQKRNLEYREQLLQLEKDKDIRYQELLKSFISSDTGLCFHPSGKFAKYDERLFILEREFDFSSADELNADDIMNIKGRV